MTRQDKPRSSHKLGKILTNIIVNIIPNVANIVDSRASIQRECQNLVTDDNLSKQSSLTQNVY